MSAAPERAPAGGSRAARANFLFREDAGTIDAATWRLHAGWLVALLVGLTLGWRGLRPYAHHDLAKSAFIAPMTILAFAYLVVYAFAIILIAVCFVMLSTKRLRDTGLPIALAGLVPLLLLLAASLHFLRAQTPDVVTIPYVIALDLILAIAAVGTAFVLGSRASAAHGRTE